MKEWQHYTALRRAEFWADARDELAYDRWLSEDAVRRVEDLAKEYAPEKGVEALFGILQDLVDLLRIVKFAKGEPR